MNIKKGGFILLLAGLTLAVAATATGWSRPFIWAGVGLGVAGAVLLAAGMWRFGPRDEELPTAEGRPERGR